MKEIFGIWEPTLHLRWNKRKEVITSEVVFGFLGRSLGDVITHKTVLEQKWVSINSNDVDWREIVDKDYK